MKSDSMNRRHARSFRVLGALGVIALVAPGCLPSGDDAIPTAPGPGTGTSPPANGGVDPDAGPTTSPPAAGEWTPDPEQFDIAITRDVPVTMPDGRVLRAQIQNPVDRKTRELAPGPFPIVLAFTPYGKTMFSSVSPYLVKRGYIGVTVDVAGTGGSEGEMALFSNLEAQDSKNVITWAAALPRSNGKVGTTGVSYLAITQLFAAAAVGPGSPLKAIFPVAAAVDPYRDLFVSGGLVNLESSLGLIVGYGGVRTVTPIAERGLQDPLDALRLSGEHAGRMLTFELQTAFDVLLAGERRFDGPYWDERAPRRVLADIVKNDVAVFMVGGLYDVFQRGNVLVYSGLQNASVGRPVEAPMLAGQVADSRFQMLFGPWTHSDQIGGAMLETIPMPAAVPDLDLLQLRWFDEWLKGRDTGVTKTKTPLRVIEPGGHTYQAASYPVETTKPTRFYLDGAGKLSRSAPTKSGSEVLPFTSLSELCMLTTKQFSAGILPCDGLQVLPGPGIGRIGYTSEPLAAPLTLAGPIGVTLHATANTRNTVFIVTVDDVRPDGIATELSSGALLGSFREVDPAQSWPSPDGGWLIAHHPLTRTSEKPVTPFAMTRYDIEVRPIFATLPAGHRIRIRIGTGDLPHLMPTPQALPALLGGLYNIHHGPAALSWVDFSAAQ